MNSERFILEAAFPASSNVNSKHTCKQKPLNHMWRSKLFVAFIPPVLGSYFEPMWCASNGKVRMKMLASRMAGSYFRKECNCASASTLWLPWLSESWDCCLAWARHTGPVLHPPASRPVHDVLRGGTRRGSDEEKWASFARLLEQETQRARACHLLQQLWWHPKTTELRSPHRPGAQPEAYKTKATKCPRLKN